MFTSVQFSVKLFLIGYVNGWHTMKKIHWNYANSLHFLMYLFIQNYFPLWNYL